MDMHIINAIDTITMWDQDTAFSCVTALAALRYRD
jgi:hypothetical protein